MEKMKNPAELAQIYMESFFGQTPLKNMELILAKNFIFEGPFHRFTSAKDYLKALNENPPINANYEIEDIFENENSVCFIYQFLKPGVKTRMAQTFEVYNEKIHKIKLVFDSKAII